MRRDSGTRRLVPYALGGPLNNHWARPPSSSGLGRRPFTPFSFAGEDEVTSSVMGAITDLNVMTRRGRFKAEVTTRRVDDEGLELEPAPGAVESLVAVLDGQITAVTTRGASVDLKPLDVISGYCAPLALSGLGVVEVISVLAADS